MRTSLVWPSFLLLLLLPFASRTAAQDNQTGPPAVTIEEMVVTGEATGDRPLMEAPASVTVIPPEEIAANTARTVDDLLKTTVGVDVYKPWGMFGPSSHVRLRGFANPRATIFLRDGVPINRMVCGGAIHNEIPLDIVERVEVVRGANATLFGAGAMGGVINIVTKKPGEKAQASVDGSYGSHNTWTANAMLNGAMTDKINLQVNYNHFDTDGYFAWADSWVQERTRTMSLQNLASWEPVKDNYLASLQNQKREMDNLFAKLRIDPSPQSTINAAYSYWRNDNDIGYRYGSIDQERNRGSIDYRYRGKFDLTGNLFFLEEDMAFSQPVLPAPWMTIGEGEKTWVAQGEKNDIPIRDGGGMLSFSTPMGQRQRLTVATDQRLVSTENTQYDGETGRTQSISQGKQYKWGVVVQDAITTGRLTSTLSLRYDAIRTFDFFSEDLTSHTAYETRSDDQLNPKIGFSYQLSDQTTFRASAGRVSTFPPLMYLIGNYETPPGRTMLGNPDLKTEYSYSYEIGMEQYFASGVMVRATAFYNDIRDWMQEVTTNDPAYSAVSVRWENIEKARTAGVEVEAEYYPTDDLKLFANYNHTNSEIVEFEDKGHNYKNSDLEGNRFPTQPCHRFNAGITWFNPRLATVNLSMRYVGDRYWDVENDVELDDFITFDIKISRKFTAHLSASLEVTDLLDEAWQETEMHVTPGRMIMGRIKIEY